MLRFGEFTDPAAERSYRLHAMEQEVRTLRRNLFGLMVFYLMPLALDFLYFPKDTVYGLFLPLRAVVYAAIAGIILIPSRESTYRPRQLLVLLLLGYIWAMATLVAVKVERPDAALTVSFFIMIVVLMNYLFLPTRWVWMVAWGITASVAYVGVVMPLADAPARQIATATVMQALANLFGGFTAYQLSTLRRTEYHRMVQLDTERHRLAEANGELQKRETIIAEQRDRLAAQVRELEEAQRRLLETQASLVQAEKMASLGQLVAGVAHELNTPMGIAVTAATHMQDSMAELDQALSTGKLTRSQLRDYQETLRESSRLVTANLTRAAGLVQSFKQVAVDQASAERRPFELGPYVEEVLQSLAPRLKRERHKLVVDCPAGLVLDSYPGALSQVLTNLLINALTHAYEPGQAGRIGITAAYAGADGVELRFSDDGRGIPAENQGKVFDPFFTTARGQGGSGLGLHIVYNLVTQTLRGTIRLESAPGSGTTFILTLPRRVDTAPAQPVLHRPG
ncbi:hypothetical protein HHL28_02405 [Aerophototrophica crusticola]|uniref:histidine kinase n=1 Tax=Aerophototrophica crusticola TaxID=1709002 RepID=A0A858R400_9PROT|nr:hypothetical protein HHL28_02405 [Rhodospirillaceae bacterium B3]